MEPVSMNDGLDVRETIAFGLGAAELAVAVLGVLSGYAVLRLGLPPALGWGVAGLLAGGGAALAWGRLGGRPLLEWAVLLVRFAVRNRAEVMGSVRAGLVRWRGASRVVLRRRGALPVVVRGWRVLRAALRGWRVLPAALRGRPVLPVALRRGPMVLPVALRSHAGDLHVAAGVVSASWPASPGAPSAQRFAVLAGDGAGADPPSARAWVVAFFSLNGGTGRTTLAVELATLLALRAGARRAAGGGAPGVALADLTRRSPGVALRLGIPLPDRAAPGSAGPPPSVTLASGLAVLAAAAPDLPSTGAAAAWARASLAQAEECAGMVVVDIDCDLGEPCLTVLDRCDQVVVTLTASAGGALDAYRSTAALRRLGVRDRLAYVINRAHGEADLAEVMGDLGGEVVAVLPEDAALVEAELRHQPAVLEADAPVAGALAELAGAVEAAAGVSAPAGERWGGRAG
jgi:MinD-like ATPase involved in chromosome partitioning or flagellar assembly